MRLYTTETESLPFINKFHVCYATLKTTGRLKRTGDVGFGGGGGERRQNYRVTILFKKKSLRK
ncbi:MAG: hypothetical protein ACI9GZ_004027 [Bacteroidia bacterium]|jgi:hypothetical protein